MEDWLGLLGDPSRVMVNRKDLGEQVLAMKAYSDRGIQQMRDSRKESMS